jgi:hypothetical protein
MAIAARHPCIAMIPEERIARAILLIRGRRVLLDADLAAMYGVETRALVQAVKRNAQRFPADFMLRLASDEAENLRSQFVISRSHPHAAPSKTHGGRRHPPYAFTEQGVAMLSSVLKSPRAIAVNIEIMRAFVQLRQLSASHAHLARRLDQLEMRYDGQFKVVFDAIRQLMTPPVPRSRRVGFRPGVREP